MAQSQCGFCHGTSFELKTEQVSNARFDLILVKCAACGAVVGVLQQEDAARTAQAAGHFVADKLREMEDRLAKKIEDLLKPSP